MADSQVDRSGRAPKTSTANLTTSSKATLEVGIWAFLINSAAPDLGGWTEVQMGILDRALSIWVPIVTNNFLCFGCLNGIHVAHRRYLIWAIFRVLDDLILLAESKENIVTSGELNRLPAKLRTPVRSNFSKLLARKTPFEIRATLFRASE